MRGKPFKELHEFMNMAQYAAAKPAVYKDIYFCLSTQAVTGKEIHGNVTAARHKQHALTLKAIWLDVDVKKDKGYDTKEDAIDAIFAFCVAASLPNPSALVFSGSGVHVYWISDIPLTRDVWRPYAEGLKAEVLRLGLKCDAGLTTDEARVLRVPGTFNAKTTPPKPVKLVHLGPSLDFGRHLAALAAVGHAAVPNLNTVTVTSGKPAPFDLRAFAGVKPAAAFAALDPQKDNLATGMAPHSDLPLNPDEVFKGCVHFQDSALKHGVGQSQGLWMQTVLASTWFEEGREWAHYLSKGYPTYTRGETDAMYDRKLKDREGGLGWPGCKAFEGDGAKCKTCPFYGKIRSPLNLAERVHPPNTVAQPAPIAPEDMNLPAGYTVNPDNGWICEIVQKTLQNGVTVEEMQPLFMCQLRNFTAQGGKRQMLFETSLDLDRWGLVSLSELDLTTEQSMIKALRRDGVKPFVPNQRRITHFMTSFMSKLDHAKQRIETVPYGWIRPEKGGELPTGFAYGGRVVLAGGGTQKAGYADHMLEDMYKPKGDPSLWHKALHIVTAQHHPALEAIIAASLAAPLLTFTGKYNGVFCAWSNGSGAHKTTSVHIGAAIWGSPKRTKERPTASQKGLLHKLGQIKNLPVYLDEVNDADKMDQVRTMLGDATEGGTGSKLKQDRSFYEPDEWQTLMLVGANLSLTENIMQHTKSTDAGLQRVFEYFVEPREDTHNENEVSQLINALDYNFGHVGLAYSEVLGRDPAAIKAYVNTITEKFNAEVGHVSPERFRAAMAATTYAGAALGNQYLGCDFNLEELWEFLKNEYINQRNIIKAADTIGGTQSNTANAITQFFKACVRNALWVGSLPASKVGKPPSITFIAGPSRERPEQIHVRLAVNDKIIDVSRQRLSDYLIHTKHDVGAVINGLKRHFNATIHERVNLAIGSGVLGGREIIVRIPVPDNSPFVTDLYTHTPLDQRPATVAVTQVENDEEVVAEVTPKNEQSALATATAVGAADLAVVRAAQPH